MRKRQQILVLEVNYKINRSYSPYKPANYSSSHLSPSKKPSQLADNRAADSFSPNFSNDNMANQNIINPQPMSLKLSKAHSANPVSYQQYYQGDYNQSMGYVDPSLNPYQMHQNQANQHHMHPAAMQMSENINLQPGGFMPQMHYGNYERDTFSPEVPHHGYIDHTDSRRYSSNEGMHSQGGWNQYQSHYMQPFQYPNQVQSRPSAPEQPRNIKNESGHPKGKQKKAYPESEDPENKSSMDDGANHLDISAAKLIENASQLAKDQSGCRLLQKKIDEGDMEVITSIYNSILPNFVDLMNNPFGNYLCQKITDALEKKHLLEILEKIKPDVVSICKNSHGTRAIQKIVECSHDQELIAMIIDLLKDHVKTLVEDINGNHAIQRILFTFGAPNNEFIFETMIKK